MIYSLISILRRYSQTNTNGDADKERHEPLTALCSKCGQCVSSQHLIRQQLKQNLPHNEDLLPLINRMYSIMIMT